MVRDPSPAYLVLIEYHPERAVQTGIGPVTVKMPKVRAKDGKPVTFAAQMHRRSTDVQAGTTR